MQDRIYLGVKMDYELIDATSQDKAFLIKNKRNIILEFSENLSDDELKSIDDYVNDEVNLNIHNTKIIKLDGKVVGSITTFSKDDGIFLDEIYIDMNYRNKGIGTKIIEYTLKNNKVVYLNVYKANKKAVSLYKKLGFIITDETKTRYFMKFENKG